MKCVIWVCENVISTLLSFTFTATLENAHNYDRILHKEGTLFMPQIRPITDLRNTNEISDARHAVKEPVQLIDNAIAETEEVYEKTGILLDAKETLAGLRRRHFG